MTPNADPRLESCLEPFLAFDGFSSDSGRPNIEAVWEIPARCGGPGDMRLEMSLAPNLFQKDC